jgi:hypothetical protein
MFSSKKITKQKNPFTQLVLFAFLKLLSLDLIAQRLLGFL